MTTRAMVRALAWTGRTLPPAVATAAVIGLGIFAWRAWLRVHAEERWLTEWTEFRNRHLPEV